MDNNSSIVAAFIGSLVRWALAFIFGAPIMEKILGPELMHRILTEGTPVIVAAILGIIVPIGLSWWNKIIAKVREKTALDVDPKAKHPEAVVTKITREMPLPEKLSVAFEGEK